MTIKLFKHYDYKLALVHTIFWRLTQTQIHLTSKNLIYSN